MQLFMHGLYAWGNAGKTDCSHVWSCNIGSKLPSGRQKEKEGEEMNKLNLFWDYLPLWIIISGFAIIILDIIMQNFTFLGMGIVTIFAGMTLHYIDRVW